MSVKKWIKKYHEIKKINNANNKKVNDKKKRTQIFCISEKN